MQWADTTQRVCAFKINDDEISYLLTEKILVIFLEVTLSL